VDAAITESVFSMLEACVPEWVEGGVDREPSGSTISGVVPSATFRTADARWCVVGGNGDSVYTRLMEAVGRPDMGAQSPAFKDNAARCARADEIYEVSERTRERIAPAPPCF
jgi:crotonobetainyl-CoA:carnitine CoA-transferase CaiB-like acyl-CoA transferase